MSEDVVCYTDGGHERAGTQDSDIDRAIQRIASEKTDVEDKHPQNEDALQTDAAYLHGKWRGLKTAIEILEEEREADTGTSRSGDSE